MKDKSIYSVSISPSKVKGSKYSAVFRNKDNKKINTLNFGAKGYRDYTLINNPKSEYYLKDEDKRNDVKRRYIARHARMGENWSVPNTKGSLSRWVLWEKTNINDAINAYKKRFKLK